ncbi:MAG: hypothetical protein ACRD0J_05990 [Acidimicrobiales bacterium]
MSTRLGASSRMASVSSPWAGVPPDMLALTILSISSGAVAGGMFE